MLLCFLFLMLSYVSPVAAFSIYNLKAEATTESSFLNEIQIGFDVGECDPVTNRYIITGTLGLTNPPATGSLILADCNGNQAEYFAPFAATIDFELTDLYPDALDCDLTAHFTANLTCTTTENFTAPLPCCTNPTIQYAEPGCFGSCTGEINVVADGAGPFDYRLIDISETTPSLVALSFDQVEPFSYDAICPGDYTLVIVDEYACSSHTFFTMSGGSDYSNITEELSSCSSVTVNGVEYTSSQPVTNNYLTITGCDSIVQSIITILPDIPNTNINVDLCAGQTYTEGATEYNSAGIYSNTYETIQGCDSTVITNITAIPDIITVNPISICNGESYTEDDSVYTVAGTYQNIYESVAGCDSTVTTILEIVQELFSEIEVSICDGHTHTEGTSDYSTAGTYEETYETNAGCDSTVITVLSIIPDVSTINEVFVCNGESYQEGDSEYTSSGVYETVHESSAGCDSTVTTMLVVLPLITDIVQISICEGESYTVQEIEYSESGTYPHTFESEEGCDSLVYTVLNVIPNETTPREVSICDGDTHTEGDSEYASSGSYIDNYLSYLGCDSIVTTQLTVYPVFSEIKESIICEGSSYFEGESEYTNPGTYTTVYETINGCDSTITTVLTVNEEISTANFIELCEGESYSEGESTYDQTGDYEDIYTSSLGCDSIVTTTVVVHPSADTANNIDICDDESYTEGDSEYTTSGVYIDIYQTVFGCDSIVTTSLTVFENYNYTNTIQIPEGESYFEGGSEYTSSGTYTNLYQTINGCDSLVTTILTVNEVYLTTNTISLCEGESYSEGDSEYTESGTYQDLYASVLGTDSLVITALTINPVYLFTNDAAICDGETYSEGNSNYSTSGTYIDVYETVAGCDSTITTSLIVFDNFNSTNTIQIPEGESYFEGGSEYTSSGTYTNLYQTINGCDSLVTTILTVNEVYLTTNTISLCEGESYSEGDSEYSESGTYQDLYTSVLGTDSLVITALTINPVYLFTTDAAICDGETYSEGNSNYSTSSTYIDVYETVAGCDSTVTTSLIVFDNFNSSNTIQIPEGESYFEGDSEYTSSGTYTNLYQTINGCDSLVTTILTVNEVYQTTNTISLCEGESYSEGDSEYTVSGTYQDLYTSVLGTDSLAITALTINPVYLFTTDAAICDGETYSEGNSNYSTSGTYIDLYETVAGCDSTITTSLIVFDNFNSTNTIQIPEGESYFEGDAEYTSSGTFTDLYQTINGCDSLVTTILTVNEVYQTTNTISLCEGESYSEGDSEYTESGTYQDLYASVLGTDSLVITELSINPVYLFTNDAAICDGETYSEGNSNYSTSGTYIDIYETVAGCDSTITTSLTVFDNFNSTNTVQIPEGESYFEGDSEYTSSGTYTDLYQTINGCDSLVTIILTVNEVYQTTNTISLCEGESYSEGDSEYTESGTYQDLYTSVLGTDSLVITALTINPVYLFTNDAAICDGETYSEGNSNYSTSGTYIDVYETVAGCDSTITTSLTVFDNFNSTNTIQIPEGESYFEGGSESGCDSTITTSLTVFDNFNSTNTIQIPEGESYFEGGSEYTSSGTFTDLYQTINGCDSLVTTILTVNEVYQTTNTISLCEGESYSEGDSEYTESGTYQDLYTSILGTDSIIITILTVNPTFAITNDITICDGETYSEGNSQYSMTGSYSDSYSSQGCDSIVITNLTVALLSVTSNDIFLCYGETYTEGDSIYNFTGTYTNLYQNLLGCDSLVITELQIAESAVSPQIVTLCPGETYTEGDSTYDTSGMFMDMYSGVNGCDSLVMTEIIILQGESTINDVEICAGEIYSEDNSIYSTTGIYTDIYTTIFGCDSTVITELTVTESILTEHTFVICEEEEIDSGEWYYDATNGMFIDSLESATGCDSVIHIFIEYPEEVLPSNISICNGQSFIANLDHFGTDFLIQWNTGENSETKSFSEAGIYWVDISSENCIFQDSIEITVHEAPTLLTTSLDLCTGTEKLLSLPENNGTVTWGNGFAGHECTVNEGGIYGAQVNNSCGTYNYTYEVFEKDCSCEIYIPNAFTPNSDQLNEVFSIVHECDFVTYELLIFNRWGEIIFRSSNPNKSWTGEVNGGSHYAKDGMYNYLLKYDTLDQQNRIISNKRYGSISLSR